MRCHPHRIAHVAFLLPSQCYFASHMKPHGKDALFIQYNSKWKENGEGADKVCHYLGNRNSLQDILGICLL